MIDQITNEFDRLEIIIKQFESIRNIRDDKEEHVHRGLVWLRERQNPKGYWGEKCLLDTQLVLLALGMWDQEIREWLLPNGQQGGVELAFTWLDGFQYNGSWDNNIWETAAIIQIAVLHHCFERPSILKAKKWIEEREFDNWGLDKGFKPHYISQAIIAMIMAGSPPRLIAKAKNALLVKVNEVFKEDKKIAPYIAGQIVDALVMAGVNPADEKITQVTDHLKNFLMEADVTIANWLHLCLAFRGLSLAVGNAGLEHPAIQLSVQRLFSPNRIRNDGSWYHDITLTAFALVALDSISTVRKIDGYSYQIFSSLYLTKKNIVNLIENEKIHRFLFYLYGFATPIILVGLIYLIIRFFKDEQEFLSNADFIFFLIPVLISAISFVAIRVRRLLKENK